MQSTFSKLKVLSLFAGIGGIDYGLERTGLFETVAFCEIDEHCHKVLNKHWPLVPIFNDVAKLDLPSLQDEGIYNVDIICGGYPCTGHSVAGKQEGLKNEGSKLWYEYLRIIGAVRPRYVLIENSHNLRSTGLGGVIKDICEKGYNCEWQILSGYGVGAPHQRERIYIVAWRNDVAYCDPFRSWPTYPKKEKTKSEWWTERRVERNPLFGQVATFEPKSIRVDDGLSDRLHINAIDERIKQLGNSVITEIPYLIGKQIGEFEESRIC